MATKMQEFGEICSKAQALVGRSRELLQPFKRPPQSGPFLKQFLLYHFATCSPCWDAASKAAAFDVSRDVSWPSTCADSTQKLGFSEKVYSSVRTLAKSSIFALRTFSRSLSFSPFSWVASTGTGLSPNESSCNSWFWNELPNRPKSHFPMTARATSLKRIVHLMSFNHG